MSSSSSAVPWRSLTAVIAGLTVAAMTGGFNAPLFATRLDELGITDWWIGVSAASNAIGLVAVAPFAAAILARHGLARVMIWCSLAEAVLYLACILAPGFVSWTLIRLAMGTIGGVLWIAGEVWITQAATDATRGRILAIYNSAFGLGTAAGPALLAQMGYGGATPFVVATAIVLISVAPIVWARGMAPVVEDEGGGGVGFRALVATLRQAPLPMLLNLSFALVYTALFTFLPVHAGDTGLPVERAYLQLSAFAIGIIALQYPVGWLSDRGDTHLVGLGLLAASLAAVALMHVATAVPGLDLAYFFLLGGTTSGVYVVALSLIGLRFRGTALASAITVYTLMWSAGSIVGPPLVSLAKGVAGEGGLQMALVVFTGLFVPVAAAAWWRHRRAGRGDGPTS